MADFEHLPEAEWEDTLYVHTVSGTVHELDPGKGTWRRIPAPDAPPDDFPKQRKALHSLTGDWTVGGQGTLDCRDESYAVGRTWHRTAIITRITDEVPLVLPE